MITRAELRERQAWRYEQKVDHALYVIDTFIHRTNCKCFMVEDTDAEGAVLCDLVWRIDRSISGVYPEREAEHIANYGGSPIYSDRVKDEASEERYLQRGQCATYEEDGAARTEAHPLSIWLKKDVERYLQEHADLRKKIRNRNK